MRALLCLSPQRTAQASAVPTARELGHDAVAFGWQGVSVPSGTPAPIVARLSEEMRRAIASDELRTRFETLGIQANPLDPAGFNAFVAQENAVWRPLIRELGIRLDS